jgi:beta-lactam-binding protein with PASTA domain
VKQMVDGTPVLPLPPTVDRYLQGGAESRVPDVVGRGQNDARSLLERTGWKVTVTTVDNLASRGTVVGQSPRGTALPGETITLQVSSGTVPAPPPAPGTGGDGQPAPGQPGQQGGDQGGGNGGDGNGDGRNGGNG